jgi:hypothetical protein
MDDRHGKTAAAGEGIAQMITIRHFGEFEGQGYGVMIRPLYK